MAAGSAPPNLGDGFVKYIDPTSGYAYYHNAATNESVWATEEEAAEPLAKTPGGGDAFEPVWEATKDERAVDVDAGGDDDDAAARGGGDDAASDGDAESGDDDDSDDDSDHDGDNDGDDDENDVTTTTKPKKRKTFRKRFNIAVTRSCEFV